MKAIKRKCPKCGESKVFRQDVSACAECLTAKSMRTAPSVSDREAHLRTEICRLQKDNEDLRKQRGFLRELTDQVTSAISSLEPPELLYRETKTSNSPLAAVINFSDWHIGEVIEADETEGFGRFNWAIAQERIASMTDSFLEQTKLFQTVFKIPNLYVLGLGDFVSGDIHGELLKTNEFPLPVQTAKAGFLFAEAVRKLSGHFKQTTVVEVGADNHGRLTAKPQFKQKAANNMSFLVYTIANARLEQLSNVAIDFPMGMRHLVNINGCKYLLEHGDTIKSWQGIPYMGMSRHMMKEGFKRMQTPLGFDYMVIGHFHVPALVEGKIIINGSLSGTSEFDHGCGRHSGPAQVSFLSHPKWGRFALTDWRA